MRKLVTKMRIKTRRITDAELNELRGIHGMVRLNAIKAAEAEGALTKLMQKILDREPTGNETIQAE